MNEISNSEINRESTGPRCFISHSDNGGKRQQGLKELSLMRVSGFPLFSTYQIGNQTESEKKGNPRQSYENQVRLY